MNSRRSRNGRNGGKRSYGSGHNRSFESNGPDVKVRGTANQVFDKYIALARDATAAGDRIAAEGYFQHAEHYFRVYTEANQARQAQQQSQRHSEAGNGTSGERDRSEPREERVVPSIATEGKEPRDAELSESDVARSEAN